MWSTRNEITCGCAITGDCRGFLDKGRLSCVSASQEYHFFTQRKARTTSGFEGEVRWSARHCLLGKRSSVEPRSSRAWPLNSAQSPLSQADIRKLYRLVGQYRVGPLRTCSPGPPTALSAATIQSMSETASRNERSPKRQAREERRLRFRFSTAVTRSGLSRPQGGSDRFERRVPERDTAPTRKSSRLRARAYRALIW